jgi:hypothetical protein
MCDFVVFPVLWSLHQAMSHGNVASQWTPITLQGAGLFHIAMGAILGIAAYGRTQEKMAGANNGGIQAPGGFGSTSSFGAPSSGFSSPAPSFGNAAPRPAPSFGAAPGVGTSSCGRAMPVPQEDPPL